MNHARARESYCWGDSGAFETKIRRFEEKGVAIASLGTFPFSRPAVFLIKDFSEDLELSDFLFSGSKNEIIRHIFRVPDA